MGVAFSWFLLISSIRLKSVESERREAAELREKNSELRTQLAVTDRKLAVCQNEIAVTSQQLSRLEELAVAVEDEKLRPAGSQYDSEVMRSVWHSRSVISLIGLSP